jgi:hypothetical protein
MIQGYVADIAAQKGIPLLRVSLVEGRTVGCLDVYLLHLAAERQMVSALVYQSELDNLYSGSPCDRLEVKVRVALSRLQMLLNP